MKKKSNRNAAFFRTRLSLAVLLSASAGVLATMALGFYPLASASAQRDDVKSGAVKPPQPPPMQAVEAYHQDISVPLRDMALLPIVAEPEGDREGNLNPKIPHQHQDAPDPVIQKPLLAQLAPSIPNPILNFNGIPFPGVACNCAPPDTNGEVGATQYVQTVNIGFQVFNKSTGASLLGPASIGTLWAGFGGVCETGGKGDPVVLYDQLANRWVITQFASATSNITDECVAVSTTNDATGTYARYGFHLGENFYDYPHLSVWPDGYYMAMNVFNAAGTAFLGPQAFVFNRVAMIAGGASTFITPGVTGGAAEETFLPADLDGSMLPPAGAAAPFVEWPSGSPLVHKVFKFHADFATPANSTFTLFGSVPAAPFTALCPTTRACVPQLGSTTNLDAVADRLMFRLAYRNFGSRESLVGNYTVSANGVAGIRWFEMRNISAGPITMFQESTYQPDSTHRWMGSVAMNGNGDMAMGFSASSAAITPQIRYAGRLVTDPINTLGQGEKTLFAGAGSQSGTSSRWGDYSDLTVDPVDDATFWYTTEYYDTTSSFNWRTRIGSFQLLPQVSFTSGGTANLSAGPNGKPDPGETVSVSLGITNNGSAGLCSTAALTGTLQATGGVTNPNPVSQNYGVICAGDPTVFRTFTFKVDPALSCGSTVTASLVVTDGTTNYGTFTYTFATGTAIVSFTENFDGVVAPALPAGWVATNVTGVAPTWVTRTTAPDTAPNTAFVDDPPTVSDKVLDTPGIAISSATAQLSFRNSYVFEGTTTFYDGGVLEVSSPNINGGAYTDVTNAAVGGSFVSGGYNGTLSTCCTNPLGGRRAWGGNSNGYINTVANLGPNVAGQTIKLRFRMGSDTSVSAAGWSVDTISITGGNFCAPVAQSAGSRKTHGTAGTFDVPLALAGNAGIEPRRGGGASFDQHQMVVNFATPVSAAAGNTVSVTSGTGSVSSFSFSGNSAIINLSGVANAQRLAVTLSNVSDGTNTGAVAVPMGILLGDGSGDGIVNTGDAVQTRARAGQTADGTNFRYDVNPDGIIGSVDTVIVRGQAGSALPPLP